MDGLVEVADRLDYYAARNTACDAVDACSNN
jgi:hypothetical protein